jgi:hypothetical protein
MTYLEKGVELSNLFHYTVLLLAWKTWEIHRILNVCKDSPIFRPGSKLWSRQCMLNFGFNVTTSSAEVTWLQTGQEYDWELELNAYSLRFRETTPSSTQITSAGETAPSSSYLLNSSKTTYKFLRKGFPSRANLLPLELNLLAVNCGIKTVDAVYRGIRCKFS